MSPADSPFAPLPAPGPHPATAELRAYAAGTLSPAEEHRIEAHLLDCERCADIVEGFSMSDAATTDRAVAELRTRLQARIGQEEPAPVAGGWAWPRIAAAAALLAAVGGGIWTLEQHQTAPAPATARLEKVAPAPAPIAAPESAPVTTPEAEAAQETAGKPTRPKLADYAAVVPSQPKNRTAPRTIRRSSRATDAFANRTELADTEAPLSSAKDASEAKVSTAAPMAAAPSPTNAAGYSSAGPPPAATKSETTLASRAAPDSAATLSEVAVASPMKKAKAKAASPTASMVVNTPMPTAPAISPAPVGGSLAFREYLRREASQFESEINNLRLSGTVRVQFTVEADGKLSHLKVTRGLRKDYDDEALRLVCEGPAWQPGIAGGKRAPLPMEVTVPF
ncbi:zf-HC2 domain-containing protein [Hymenobacter rubidus]|uniref:zf-HC2 domain-containing protein n=1 Tax=Hymenobacter rubidus TaxID=1441626 RepID=UPI00191E3124|nr:zf-HC2 domain-containing protein [Hymenobacter rubidus]